jgi:hypothetical protein
MRRLAILPALLGLLLVAPAADAKPPRALVEICDRPHQAAVFAGRMDTVPGAVRMQMRFRLQVTTPDGPGWVRLPVKGFSAWVTSDPGHARYVYSKRVEALLAPASYRVQMRFRWLDADGGTVRTARAISRSCRQPDPRADLRVATIVVRPGVDAASRRYAITVRNAGRSATDASDVSLELADGTRITGLVGGLEPWQREVLVLDGPVCQPGSAVTATADAGDAVDERDEDNALSVACPA